MRKADPGGDKRAQLPFAILQHVEKAERELVKIRVEGFLVSTRSRVALAETGVVAAPHEFRLRIFVQGVIDERAEAQSTINAQAIDDKGIIDRIGSARLVADERRNFPFCYVAPLSECRRDCYQGQREHEQQRQAVSHRSSKV